VSPLSGCYYLRTRAAVDAIKFTVDAAVAGMAFLSIFALRPHLFIFDQEMGLKALRPRARNKTWLTWYEACSVEPS
jgi:hypothetical protein